MQPGLPDDAYGKFTQTERFGVLHQRADALVADLEVRYHVERTDGLDVDLDLATLSRSCARLVRLTPTTPDAAPLTVAWTTFPGLLVRLGRWHVEAYPHCGCDACAEDPTDLTR